MKIGAVRARERIQELFRTVVKKNSMFQRLYERQLKEYQAGFDTNAEVLYNYQAATIRSTSTR